LAHFDGRKLATRVTSKMSAWKIQFPRKGVCVAKKKKIARLSIYESLRSCQSFSTFPLHTLKWA